MKITTRAADALATVRFVILPVVDPQTVVTETQDPRPDRFVQLTRTGGVSPDAVRDKALITIDTWDLTEAEAGDTASLVQAAVVTARHTTVNGVVIGKVRVAGGPVYFQDPLSHAHRYRQIIEVATRSLSYP